MIFVSNLRRKSFRLYLEMESETEIISSLFRDENFRLCFVLVNGLCFFTKIDTLSILCFI